MANEQLVQEYQRGNELALDKLVKQNTKLVYHICNKFYINNTPSIEKEDLEQEGMLGLVLAAQRYKADKGAKFSTFASYYIYGYMNRLAVRGNTGEETSLDVEIGEYITLGDTFKDSTDHMELSMLRLDLENVMRKELNATEESTIRFQYGWDFEELSIKEIAGVFDEPITATKERVRKAMGKMRMNKIVTEKWDRDIKARKLENKLGSYSTNRLMKVRYM